MISEKRALEIMLSDRPMETKAYLIHLESKPPKARVYCPVCRKDCTEHYMGLEVYMCNEHGEF